MLGERLPTVVIVWDYLAERPLTFTDLHVLGALPAVGDCVTLPSVKAGAYYEVVARTARIEGEASRQAAYWTLLVREIDPRRTRHEDRGIAVKAALSRAAEGG